MGTREQTTSKTKVRELSAAEARRDLTAEYERLGYGTTENVCYGAAEGVSTLEDFIGLDRAQKAAIRGLKMRRPDWNIYLRYGTAGRHSFVDAMLKEQGYSPEGLSDICLVHAFGDEETDCKILYPQQGLGKELKQDVADLITWLQDEALPSLTQHERYVQIEKQWESLEGARQEELTAQLAEAGVCVFGAPSSTSSVYALSTADAPKPDFAKGKRLVKDYLIKQVEQDKIAEENKKGLLLELATELLDKRIDALRDKFGDEDISAWLTSVGEDVKESIADFLPEGPDKEREKRKDKENERRMRPELLLAPELRRYEVNLQMDHSMTSLDRALVVKEDRPTHSKIAGKRKIYSSSFTTNIKYDHMSVDLGSLVSAKGGYYVVDIEEMIRNGSWFAFQDVLKRGEVKIGESGAGLFGLEVEGPKIDAVNITDVKVILVGERAFDWYVQQYYLEEQFLKKHFKIKADFERDVDVDETSIDKVARYIAKIREEQGLLHFDKTGIAAAAEHLLRMAKSKEDFSLDLGSGGLPDVLVEADFLAKEEGAQHVTRKHLQQALDDRYERTCSLEDRYRKFFLEDLATIDFDGAKVGEAHALSVYQGLGEIFCVPTKATAVTSADDNGIVDIMEEVNLAGEVYRFGMNELESYIKHVFGQDPDNRLSFEGRIVKEESYGDINGNSSSALNTIVLLSRLSGVPLKQNIAMTGGISQTGQVVPIGAESIKVEGFYKACKMKGLLDKRNDSGVIIPEKNVKGLQLHPEVVQAIEEGKFHVWQVDRIEDAVEICTGIESGATFNPEENTVTVTGGKDTVYHKAARKLREYSGNLSLLERLLGK